MIPGSYGPMGCLPPIRIFTSPWGKRIGNRGLTTAWIFAVRLILL